MKRFRLPKGAKGAIRAWLALPTFDAYGDLLECKERTCPFIDMLKPRCSKVCEKVFLRSKQTGQCPCREYTMEYVIRRAKEIIR